MVYSRPNPNARERREDESSYQKRIKGEITHGAEVGEERQAEVSLHRVFGEGDGGEERGCMSKDRHLPHQSVSKRSERVLRSPSLPGRQSRTCNKFSRSPLMLLITGTRRNDGS